MSSGMSSDQIIKYEIIEKVGRYPNVQTRIFPDSSNDDQKLVENGGLTFSHGGLDYGSCDAGWFQIVTENGTKKYVPLIALEGTDALNRGSSGDAQYQRFHHALGAVKNGVIGIYYLRKGTNALQLDLYEMAYNATKYNPQGGAYLIVQDLTIVDKLLALICEYGRNSNEVKQYLDNYIEWMHDTWRKQKFSQYNYDWNKFADKRSTIIYGDAIIKYAGRMKRNYTDSSQRAGHIAVGEMYLSKYLYYGKKVYYHCPRMCQAEVDYLDKHKRYDKEWSLLRNEDNVVYMTRDNLVGLPDDVARKFAGISDLPMKGDALRIYNECIKILVNGLKSGEITIKE